MGRNKRNLIVWKIRLYGDGEATNEYVYYYEDEDGDTFFENLREMKEHLKTLPANERHKVKDFERLRNLANGLDPNEGMDEIDMIISQLEEEEEKERKIERSIEENTFDPYDVMTPRAREEIR